MKSKFLLLVLIIPITILVGCTGLNKMVKKAETVTYEVTPNPLEVHGDSILVSVSGKYPEKYFGKKVIVVVNPIIKYGDIESKLKIITLQGENAEGDGKVIKYSGGSFSYTDKIKYVEGMENSTLNLTANASVKSKTKEIPSLEVAKGAILTSKMVQSDEMTVWAKDNFTKTKPVSSNADIHYSINKANISGKEMKASDVEALRNFVKKGKESNYIFKNISISSYASPDGAQDLNQALAEERGAKSSVWMEKELKKMQLEFGVDTFVTNTTTAEDWEGFKELMDSSNIEDKDLILRVLSMYTDPIQRETEIKNIAAAYGEIAETILPKLRKSKFILNAEELSLSDSLIIFYANTKPDTLALEDLIYATTLIEDLDVEIKLMETVCKNFPDDWRGPNNLGALLIEKEDFETAKSNLEKALELSGNDNIAKNNMGVALFKLGEQADAKSYFEQVEASLSEARYNLGNIAVIEGIYVDAINYYADNCTFNNALVKNLSGDYDAALQIYDECLDAEMNADSYYLKAIISARKDETGAVISNLKEAIKLDSGYKIKAKDDLEFHKLFDNSDFIGLVE